MTINTPKTNFVSIPADDTDTTNDHIIITPDGTPSRRSGAASTPWSTVVGRSLPCARPPLCSII
jgi:hypothetical protein